MYRASLVALASPSFTPKKLLISASLLDPPLPFVVDVLIESGVDPVSNDQRR
jgi:hypothetical protein